MTGTIEIPALMLFLLWLAFIAALSLALVLSCWVRYLLRQMGEVERILEPMVPQMRRHIEKLSVSPCLRERTDNRSEAI